MHLDNVQKELNAGNGKYDLAVFDYNQLLALCMGFDPKQVASICSIPRDKIISKF
jgi:heterodisulfide reductase subunit B